jgi:hypothetical protein
MGYIAAQRKLIGSMGLGLLLLLNGCQSEPEKPALRVSFDDLHGWVQPEPTWMTDTIAHSGRWAGQLLANTDFTPPVLTTWEDLGRPRKIRVGSWIWLAHGRQRVALIIGIERNGELLFRQSIPIYEVVKRYRQWELVHQTYTLPKDLQDGDQVKVYLWQWEFRHTLYFDDLFVEKLR